MNKLFKVTLTHGFSFKGLKDADIKGCTPAEAFEYKRKEGDKYIKIWMQGDEVYFVTWVNTLIDSKFRWATDKKRYGADYVRNNSNLIGSPEGTKAFLKSNSAINQCTEVYMIPFEKLDKYDSFKTYSIKTAPSLRTYQEHLIEI